MINFNSFHIMLKPTGPICNLNCEYCFYLEKEKIYTPNSNWEMSEFVLETFIRQYIKCQSSDEIIFAWQGGEPTLLGVDYFKKAVKLQKKYSNGKRISNTFQTNGILLNDEWCEFFAENNFLIGLSIDGPEEIHDKHRTFKGGQPSFQNVMKGIEYLKKYKVDFNTLTCVQKDNSYKAQEIYTFLKEIGSGFIQFIPIVERTAAKPDNIALSLVSPDYKYEANVTEWSVEPLQYGIFLTDIFNEWILKDVGKFYIQIFDVSLEVWYGSRAGLCLFNDICGSAMAIEHNGDVYSCDHYVYPENKIGNIIESELHKIVTSGKQIKFGLDKKTDLPNYCKQCKYLFICNGECPKHRFLKTPEGEEGLNYLCAGYKYFFNHIDPYMQFMANELCNQRPPANVMKWARIKR